MSLYILLKNLVLKILYWQQSYMDAFGRSAFAGDRCPSNIYGLTLCGRATCQFTASEKWNVIFFINDLLPLVISCFGIVSSWTVHILPMECLLQTAGPLRLTFVHRKHEI